MKLYELGGGYVFAFDYDYIDAWGGHCVTGTLFDTVDGTVQPNRLAWGPEWASVSNIVYGAARVALGV